MVQPKWALITGVNDGGMGDAELQQLLKRGINVVATALELSMLDYLKERTTSTASIACVELNVTSPPSIAAAVEEVSKITGGRLDYLFSASFNFVSLKTAI